MTERSTRRAFRAWVTLTVFMLLYPYDAFTPNGVYPMEFAAGVYFDGLGIAYTPEPLENLPGGPLTELTAELWVHERATSHNWGPRVLFSAYDGGHFAPFQFGEWGGRFYAYSPRHRRVHPWYEQWLMSEKLERGVDHYVALSWGPSERALYIDGELLEREAIDPEVKLNLTGRLVLGNSPDGRHGWWGEIQGLALYRRAYSASEIEDHFAIARRKGVPSLAQQPDIVALFDLPPSEYPIRRNASRNLVPGLGDLQFPPRFIARPESIVRIPDFEAIVRHRLFTDLAQNVVLFLPLGWLGFARRWDGAATTRLRSWWMTLAFGTVFSLSMELVQLATPMRAATLTDIVLNATGTGLGAFACLWWQRRRQAVRVD